MYVSMYVIFYVCLNGWECFWVILFFVIVFVKLKKVKVESSKVFEFVLVRFDDEGEDDYLDNVLFDSLILINERIVLIGFVMFSLNDNE